MNETPDIVHGRLLEAVHIMGYTFERAQSELKHLLEDDKWKQCGDGYEDIDEFLKTLKLDSFRMTIEQRKDTAKMLAEKRATQRAIAGTLGVTQPTIYRDLEHDTNVSKSKIQIEQSKELENKIDTNVSKSSNQQNPALYTSNSNEWYTPREVIDCVLHLLVKIDLDPCSNSKESPNIPATEHFTIEDNGLSLDWFGRVYMNPPYGDEIKNWTRKLRIEYEKGNVSEAIALLPSRTDTAWFRELKYYPKCFIWGRLRFNDSNPAPFPSMAVYFGEMIEAFVKEFNSIGDIHGLIEASNG
jgi:hypothetical protein